MHQEVLYLHLSTGKSTLVLFYYVQVCLYALVDLKVPLLTLPLHIISYANML